MLGSCPEDPIHFYTICNPETYYMGTWASRGILCQWKGLRGCGLKALVAGCKFRVHSSTLRV